MRKSISFSFAVMGLTVLAIGLYLVKTISDPQGILKALPYVLIGLGCGAFGHGMGDMLGRRAVKNAPELEKQMEIDRNDERNIAIAARAKAKAYDLMVYVYGALILALGLMGTDTVVILLLIFAYIFVGGYGVFCRCKLDKEM